MPSRPSVAKACASAARILREERLAQSISLTELGERAALSRQMVSYVERGLRVPTLDTLLRITRALGIAAADVIRRADG